MLRAATSAKRALVTGGNAASLSHAVLLAHHGFETILIEEDESGVVRSLDFLNRLYESLPEWMAEETTDHPKPTVLTREKLDGRFDILIDAGDANLTDRHQNLNAVSKHLNSNALIAFQTSMPNPLVVEKRGDVAPAIHQFHICGLPHLATLVECARFEAISNDPLSHFWQALGKQVITTKPEGQFAASRLSTKFYETLDRLLLEGSLPFEIDEALTTFGFAIGPYEAQDLAGLDASYYERKQLKILDPHSKQACVIADRMVQEGRLGKKVSVGWYRYPGGGGAVIDPLLEDLIVEEARFAKIERRSICDQEVVSRVVSALTDEAVLILEKGILETALDLDKLSIEALHFPHGGICAYADLDRS